MRKSVSLCSLLAALSIVDSVSGAELFVSPTGTSSASCATRGEPCDLATGASLAMPGDTVYLMDGVYKQSLWLNQTGAEGAWITFKADECATPILEGPGDAPDADEQTSGVGSQVGQYLRFEGIVARGWNIGFGNGWNGGRDSEEISNGHWQIENCISYSNGRTGFTFFSAPNFTLKNSIAAHNGTSTLHSWSSGVTLYESTGTNIVEGVISFENTDEQKRTDGSGFIVDEEAHSAYFINNIAFRNAGSCLRLTKSHGTKFINNTCYQNSQFGARAVSPTNPGEIYFTAGGNTDQNVTFINNVIVGTGVAPAGSMAILQQPTMGWNNNVVTVASQMFFTDPVGMNPNYIPNMGASEIVGKGITDANVPTTDIGFDPKCIVKRAPLVIGNMAKGDWWEFDVDIDYIKSIGGVAKCWSPRKRSGALDIGAYMPGNVTAAVAGACVPPPIPPPSTGGTPSVGGADAGGTPSAGGTTGTSGGTPSTPSGGTPSTPTAGTPSTPSGGTPGTPTAGGTSTPPAASGGSLSGAGGNGQPGAGGSPGSSTAGTTGVPTTPGNPTTETAPQQSKESGCGYRVAATSHRTQSAFALGVIGLGILLAKRRRSSRS